ncbi:unnamed protein product [Thelazia callipaeda]|uniref:Serine/threonine-protein phosphatase n=1 Tax=Thelazia callipaeda TaxID=103827 RepID=A0A0N5D5U9_THECL|nr:unnamed protein product [Thelazia callipaeda]
MSLPSSSYQLNSNYVKVKRLNLPRCPSHPCSQQKVENYMKRIMQTISGKSPKRIHSYFEHDEVLEIIHGCLTILADEPTLLQFPLPENGLVIIGDLHGDAFCLMKAFEFYGFPPNITYLFLGDFIDRGPKQNEILLLLFLMKIRWPEYIYLLRGNHELYDLTECNFKKKCSQDYNNCSVFIYLNQLFDYLPLAAIISDHFFTCHAGVSQWMTCRANIANISRPTDLNNMKILEGCIVTDILWADPKADQELPFDLSARGCCYSFNQEALHSVLRALNVHTLIRGHQIVPEGILDNFGDGSCLTVHTATRESDGYVSSGTLKIIRDDNGDFVICKRMIEITTKADMEDLCNIVYVILCKSLQHNTLKRVYRKCQWCRKAYPINIINRVRNACMTEVLLWISRYAFRYVQQDDLFHNAWENDDDEGMNVRGYKLFPILYDAVSFEGGTMNTPCTYRVLVAEWEKAFLFKLFGVVSNFDLAEPLTSDVDPGLLAIQNNKQKPGLLARTSRGFRNIFRHAMGLRDFATCEEENVPTSTSRRS